MKRWNVGTNGDHCAKNHAICEGAIVIGEVYGRGYPAGEGWHPESEADARLMAAAPKMLEALERISDIDPEGVECAERNRFKPTGCGCIGCIARAAIRKAKGEL